MPDFTKRVVKRAASDLHPGEQVLKAVVAQPPGSFSRSMGGGAGTVGGVAAAAYQSRKEKQRHADEAAGMAARIPPRNVYLTLTDRRLLVYTTTKMGGPEERVAEFGFADIAALEVEKRGFKRHGLVVSFADGSSVDLMVIQNQRPDALLEHWQRLTG